MLPFDALVLNKYRILRSPDRRDGLLGRGTYGSVYLAYEELADRKVAIKVLNVEQDDLESGQEEALRRFLTEGRLGLRIRHPNILEVHAIEPYDDGYLLVMELAESGDLKALFARGRPSQAEAVKIAVGIAHGLQAAHDRDIIHRDLKPGNVFMMRDNTPKVADFGVAHIPQAVGGYMSLTRTGFQPGTIIYMSPEQAAGRRIDHRSDLYSLAVMVFEALAGRFYVDLQRCRQEAQSRSGSTPALEELRFFQVFSEIAFTGPVPSLRDFDPSIPAWLDEVVLRGLARDPDDRWQNGRDFAAALLAGGPLASLPVFPEIDRTLIDPLTPQSPRVAAPDAVQPYAAPDADTSATPTSTSARYLRPLRGSAPAQPPAADSAPAPLIAPDAGNGHAAPAPLAASASSNAVAAPQQPAPTNVIGEALPALPEIPAFGTMPPTERMALQPAPVVVERAADAAAPSPPTDRAAAASNAALETAAAAPLGAAPGSAVAPLNAVTVAASAPPNAAAPAQPPARPSVPPATVGSAGTAPAGRGRLPLIAGAVVVLALLGGGVAFAHPWSSNKPKPTPIPVVAAVTAPSPAPSVVAEASVTPSPLPSPSPSPSPSPTPNAQTVADAAVTRPGATLVKRINVPGQGSDPGYVIAYTQAPGADGCQQPYVDLLRPGSDSTWTHIWEGSGQPQGSPVLDTVKKSDNGCFPAVRSVQAQPLTQGGQPVPLLIVGLADGSARVVALGYDTAGGVKSLVDLHTTPNATVKVSSDLPAKLSVSESVYPPPGSGLNPQYSQPVGALALIYDWKDSAFVAEGPGDLALGCLSGTVAATGKQDGKTTLLVQCPDGSSAPYSAVVIADATSLSDGIAASDIQSGDDVTLTVDPAALKASDPLNVLPAAASVQSNAALARKKAREATPTPAPAPAPVVPRTSSGSSGSGSSSSGSSGSSSSSGSTYTPPVSSAPAPQPVQSAPPPVQPAPQPVATQPPAPVNNNPGLGGGQSSGPGGGGLGGGSGSTGTGGGLGG